MTMTLEQVRDILKGWPARTIKRLSLHEADEIASAIDAYLSNRNEVTKTCRICGGQVDLSNAVKPDKLDTKGWHANARTVSDRYSSGSAQCKEPSQLINADLTSPVREYEKANAEANGFTRDGVASQPQPVAQGEAVAWISTVRCVGPDFGKEYYGKLPIKSLQDGYYEHTPLYKSGPAVFAFSGWVDDPDSIPKPIIDA